MINDAEVSKFTASVNSLSKADLYRNHVKRCHNKTNIPKEYSVVLKTSGEYFGYFGFQLCEVLGGIEILYGVLKVIGVWDMLLKQQSRVEVWERQLSAREDSISS